MTVSSTNTRNSYSGNGSTTVFAYTFKIFDDDDITVIIRTDSTGAETTKTKTTHYSVSGVGVASGGNITFGSAPASGETVVLLRTTARTQTTDYTPNDPFPAATHEDALDKLTFMVQELEETVGRSLKVSKTNVIATSEFTTSAADRANKLLSFDGSGDLTVTEGKVDTVTASVSAVSAGGSPTASATYTASSGALALAFGLVTGNTGATGNSAGLQMTFNNSTSDADPGGGKVALNNGTLGSVSEIYIDDADDNGTAISSFIATFDDVSNVTARGIIHIEKEGTAATFAIYKVSGAVTAASGYSKVPVTHLASNGTFSNLDGIRVDFTYSGNDGAGSLTDVVSDTSPELGGDLDVLARDIVSSSNRDIDLAPHGTGHVTVLGNTNPGSIQFNCESNSHGQIVKAQPHSASVTNVLTLPAGGDQTLVGTAGATFTGVVAATTFEPSADTSSGDNAAIGYTSAEGLILTGQGSSTDVTIKNDADATVASIATGTTIFTMNDDVGVSGRAVGHVTTDNDGSFDLAVGNDFKCTTAGGLTLTFTNAAAGQSGNIMFVNGGNHTIAAHADVAISADSLTAISATGTYHLAYYCSAASGSNSILVSASAALT
jgi:hypothetical protein|tara:strand:+ start:4875 stop:6695 length:1821 start_codon:yes stop_codon:yes gene_type:complete